MKNKLTALRIFTLSLFLLTILSYNTFGQGNNNPTQPIDWQLYKEVNGVQVYYKYSDCIDKNLGLEQKLVLLKFVNTTGTTFTIKWENELWYDGKCWTCQSEDKTEYTYKIILQKGSHIEGTCKHGENTDLQIFVTYLNHEDTAKLTKFELKNIEITPVY